MATRNIMVRAGADFSQLSQAMQSAQREAQGFGANMESIFTRIGFVGNGIKMLGEAVVHGLEGLKDFAQEAAELDGRLSSLNARLGGTADQFIKTSQSMTQGSMSDKDIIVQGSSITAMLHASISDSTQLSQVTEQMLKNIAIVSSATGKTQEEVSQRVVSALQGHMTALNGIDMGIHVNTLMQEPWVKSIAGSTTAWAKLNQQQQQAIMITYLNQKVQSTFGNSIINDTATRMNQFTAALSNVKTSLEQAFQPIMYAVLPYITTFINYINTALSYVTAFFQVLFGYSGAPMSAFTSGLGEQAGAVNDLAGAYGKLGESASKATGTTKTKVDKPAKVGGSSGETVSGGKKEGTGFLASFDQVHTIPEASNSGSGKGAGAGAGARDVPEVGVPTKPGAKKQTDILTEIQAKMKEVIDKMKGYLAPFVGVWNQVWGAIKGYFQEVVGQLQAWWAKWGSQITEAMKNAWKIIGPILSSILVFVWDSIKGAISGIIKAFEGIVEFLTGIFTGNWKAVFQGLWDFIAGMVQAIWNIFNLLFIADGISFVKDFAVNGIKAIGEFFFNGIKGAKGFLDNIGHGFVDAFNWIKNVIHDLDLFFYRVFDNMLHTGLDIWNGMVDGLRSAIGFMKNLFFEIVGWVANNVVNPLVNSFNNIFDGFRTGGILGGIKAVLNSFFDYINGFIGAANSVIHLIPGVSGSIPTIPHLARGGITNGPTLALIGDNAGGQEVVTPLDRLQGMMANTVAQTIAAVMGAGGNNQGGQGDIVLKIDGRQFARIIKPYTDKEQVRVGTNLRLQTL
jgi:hypothetical protein